MTSVENGMNDKSFHNKIYLVNIMTLHLHYCMKLKIFIFIYIFFIYNYVFFFCSSYCYSGMKIVASVNINN